MNPADTTKDCGEKPLDRHWLSFNYAALRYWTVHVCISAAPSFAFGYGLAPGPERLWGMTLGVVFFIILYTLAAQWTYPDAVSSALWRRAMRLATWIRTIWAALTCLVSIMGQNSLSLLFFPDFIAGIAAHGLVEYIWISDMGFILPTFLVTVIEGFILSGILFAIAFVCLGILKLATAKSVV
jgi:hypothetical protein